MLVRPCQFLRLLTLCLTLALGQRLLGQPPENEVSLPPTPNRIDPIDQIWFGPAKANLVESWETWGSHSVRARIIRLDAESVDIRDEQGNLKKLELSRVIAVRPHWNQDEAASMDRLFYDGKFAEHAKVAPTVLKSDLPPYQQRLLLAQVVVSADAIGNRVPAGTLFISLCKNSPPPFLYSVAPLNWADARTTRAMETAAQTWINDTDEAAQLLGASWLLGGTERTAATEKLEKLTRSTNAMIASLATCQLWRLIPISPADTQTLLDWQKQRDGLLLPLQLGPTELIADRWRSAQQPSLAAFEYLRIAILHRDRYDRALAAKSAAEELLGPDAVRESADRLQSLFPSAVSAKRP